jgi:transglutaminase-like putative cysteine protease
MIMDLLRRLFHWIVRSIGALTLVQLTLLWLTLVSMAGGLLAMVGYLPSALMLLVATFGLLVGWLLARTRLPGWGSGLVALGIGLTGLLLTVGRIGRPLWAFQSTLWPLAGQIPRCTIWPPLKQILPCRTPDFVPMFDAWKALTESLTTLTTRLTGWYQGVHSGIRVIDPMVTPLLWGMAFWLVVTWAAWWVRRRNAIAVGLLPAVTLLAYNVYYTNYTSGIVWLVLAGGGWVILQATDSYRKAHRRWQERRMDQTEIEPLLAGVVVLLVTGLMLAGSLLPSFSIVKLSNTIQEIFHGEQDKTLAESLGLQQAPGTVGKGIGGGFGLSATHAIGPGPQLSQEVVLYVTVDGYQPPPPPDVQLHINAPQPEVRYYWRSQTYDQYNGHVWIANTARSEEIAADKPYHPDLIILPGNYWQVHQHIERLQPGGGALFATGDLLSADQPSLAAWRASNDLIGAQTDADIYTADSRIQYVSVDQLRAAGNNYPESIRRYLELPDELPARVRDLTLDLTTHQLNPYDRAIAIESYLRRFPYSLDVPAPPSNRDVADYFLFDLKKGYCDYYATTMVVMARAAGLPARLVVGYTSGSYDYDARRFVVVEANAHSWVEIYSLGIGWVEFEPTANVLPFPRPGETGTWDDSTASVPTLAPGAGATTTPFDWGTLRQPLEIFGMVLAGLAVLLLILLPLPLESWQLYLRPADQALKAIYRRLYQRGRAWGIPADAARTPYEFALAFSARLERRAGNQRLAPFVSALRADLDCLTGLYTRLLFGPHPLTRDEHYQAVRTWAHLRRTLFRLQRG